MTVYVDPNNQPIEIAAGRGDLRYSSYGYNTIRRDSGLVTRIGRAPVSYANLFATQPYIAAAIMRMLTWSIRVPLKAYKREDEGETRTQLEPDDHAIARMIKRPWLGSNASPAALIQALLGPTLVHGNTVIEIELEGGEEWFNPLDWRDLWPLGPESGMELNGWRYDQPGVPDGPRDIALSDTVHVAWWSPLGPLGVSPLEQLGITLSVEDAAQRYQQSIFGNAARPPSAITSTPEFLSLERPDRQALMDQLRQDMEDIYQGPENAGKPAVLPPGLDWKPVGHSAAEAELIEQRKIAREEIAAVYQIPPPMIGILDHATYSNIDVQREMAYTMALGPPLVLIEQTLTATLARDYFGEEDIYLEFDFGPVLRGDRQKEIAAFREAIGTGINTMNEARRALNLAPSEEPDADRLFYPANNLKPVGDAEAEAAKLEEQKKAELEAKTQPAVVVAPNGKPAAPPGPNVEAEVIDRYGNLHDDLGRFATPGGGGGSDTDDDIAPGPSLDPRTPDLGHERTAKVDAVLGVGVVDTQQKHSRNGMYTPERTKTHRNVVRGRLAGTQENQDEPEVLFTAGGPASGKSSIIYAPRGAPEGTKARVPQPEGKVELDQDFDKAELPEYQALAGTDSEGNKIEGIEPDGYASDAVHREAADIHEMEWREALSRKMNVTAQGTGDSGPGRFRDRIKRAKQAGYKTRVVYASASTEVAKQRAVKRAEEEGRAVPFAGLEAMHANVSRFFPEIRELLATGDLDEIEMWDTSGDSKKGEEPIRFAHSEGRELIIDNQELYDAFLAKAEENDGSLIDAPGFL